MKQNIENDKLNESKRINQALKNEKLETDFDGIVIAGGVMLVLGFGGKILYILINWL